MEKQSKFWLITMVATCAVILVMWTIFFTARAYIYHRSHKSDYSGDSFIAPDPVIGYCQRPNITMRNPQYTVYSDNRGGRASAPGQVAPEKVDILAIGCSFTWGHGIQDKETYVRIIGADLGFTVYNAALAGYGTTASLLSLKKYADLHPKIIIYGFISDHINRSLNPFTPCLSGLGRGVAHVAFDPAGHPVIKKPETSSLYYKHLQDVILDHRFGVKDVYWEIMRTLNFIPKWEPNIDRFNEKQIISAMKFLMNKMVQETQKMGAKLIILYIPCPDHVNPPSPVFMEAIADIITAKKAIFLDLTRPFAETEKHHEMLSTKDGHPNALGHQLIAHELEPVIRSLGK